MRGCGRRVGVRAAGVLGALAIALGTACGGSGGGGGVFVVTEPFSAQLLPLQIDEVDEPADTTEETTTGAGDVTFLSGGDALVVGGGTDSVLRVSRTSGAVTTFAADVTGNAAVLQAIAVDRGDGTVYVGADDGAIHAIDDEGVATFLIDVGDVVNGLAFAPSGFGDVGGQLLAASGVQGIFAVDPEAATSAPLASFDGAAVYADLAFLDGVLYAVDRGNAKIDAIAEDADGVLQTQTFVDTDDADFIAPEGLAADGENRQLLVADAGAETLFAVVVPEEPLDEQDPEDREVSAIGGYDFDPGAPNGLAFDGVRNLLFVTRDLALSGLTLRGVVLPPYGIAFPRSIADTDEGFGDLLFDLDGSLVGTGNVVGESDTDDGSNRVYRLRRDGSVGSVRRDVGDALEGELLLALALDPATGTLYVGTSRGNVFALNDGGADLFSSLPAPQPGENITGLALAPANAGAELAGKLVAVTSVAVAQGEDEVGGSLYTIDLAAPGDPAVELPVVGGVPMMDGDGDLTGVLFASDGTLYVLGQDTGAIYDVTVSGGGDATFVPFASGLDLPEGIALDEGGRRFLVAQTGSVAGADALLEVALDRVDAMDPEPVELSDDLLLLGGFLPSGLAFDGLGDLFAVVDEVPLALTVDRFSVFPPEEE